MTSRHTSTSGTPIPQSHTSGARAVEVRTVQSRDADGSDLRAAEHLVKRSFGKEFRDNDWRHGLGGTHVFVNDDADTLLAHAAIVPRVIRHGTNALHVGYVEAVAVRPDFQGKGLGRVLMNQVESIVHAEYQLGALNAIKNAVPFYRHRGWALWTGATAAQDRDGGIVATDDAEDRIMLLGSQLQALEIDPSSVLTCDWRPGEVW
jgi:aminoglycoside 2'-N-acetyltransferase I